MRKYECPCRPARRKQRKMTVIVMVDGVQHTQFEKDVLESNIDYAVGAMAVQLEDLDTFENYDADESK